MRVQYYAGTRNLQPVTAYCPVDHLDRHQLIVDSQHGFRKGGSCLSNLLQFLDTVTVSLDRNNCIDVVYLDFAKAFDKVYRM